MTIESKPLQNLGEILNRVTFKPESIPVLDGRHTTTQAKRSTILHPLGITGYHKIVFCLVRAKRVLHRDEIASRTELPVSYVSQYVGKLKVGNVLISPDCGCYTVGENFLTRFQLVFGARKTERLLKMFDEANIDVSEFQPSFDRALCPAITNENQDEEEELTELVGRLIKAKRERVNLLSSKIEELKGKSIDLESEKSRIESELERFRTVALN